MPREKARTAGPVKTHGYAPCGLVCLLKRLVKQSLPQQNMQKLLSEQTVQRPRGVIDFVAEKRCNIFAARKPLLPERVAVADRDACFFADIPCRLHIPVNLPIQLKRAAVRLHLPQRRAGGVARRRACAHHVRRHKDRHAARAPQCPENLPQTILVCAKSGIAAVHVKPGDTVEVGGLLGSAPVQRVHPFSSAEFVARGGRIPAPMQSLKN